MLFSASRANCSNPSGARQGKKKQRKSSFSCATAKSQSTSARTSNSVTDNTMLLFSLHTQTNETQMSSLISQKWKKGKIKKCVICNFEKKKKKQIRKWFLESNCWHVIYIKTLFWLQWIAVNDFYTIIAILQAASQSTQLDQYLIQRGCIFNTIQ